MILWNNTNTEEPVTSGKRVLVYNNNGTPLEAFWSGSYRGSKPQWVNLMGTPVVFTLWTYLEIPGTSKEGLARMLEGHRMVATANLPSSEKDLLARSRLSGFNDGVSKAADIVRGMK